MLSNESIPGTEKVSLLCVVCFSQYQICDDYSVSFTALIFSVGIWCPEGDSTQSLLQYYNYSLLKLTIIYKL